MAIREYLRSGEVPTLYGENSKQSEFQLWNEMLAGEDDRPIDEGGIWKGRLSSEIMKGICDDHRLKVKIKLEPRDAAARTSVMPSRAWELLPSTRTGDEAGILIVDMRPSTTMRDWNAPASIPAKALRRYKAIAYAYGFRHLVVGMLVDGYSSQLFVITITDDEVAEMKRKIDLFIQSVRDEEEPDLDLDRDSRQIRSGAAVQKVAASAEQVDALSAERIEVVKKIAPLKTQVGQHEGRLTQIDTMLIAMAGTKEKLETPAHVVAITRDAKGTPKVSVVKKGATLF